MKKLKEQFKNANLLHFGVPEKPTEQLQMYTRKLIDASKKHPITIIDRCWYSDLIYAPIMRGTRELTVEEVYQLEKTVVKHGGGIVIYCTAPIKVLWERCNARGETYIPDIETLYDIAEDYEYIMRTVPRLPVIRFNTAE